MPRHCMEMRQSSCVKFRNISHAPTVTVEQRSSPIPEPARVEFAEPHAAPESISTKSLAKPRPMLQGVLDDTPPKGTSL
jgi:hypothetical protein